MNVFHRQMVQHMHIYIYVTRQHLIISSHVVEPRFSFLFFSFSFFISQPIKIFLHSTREIRPRIILDLHATILPPPPSTQHTTHSH